MAYKTIDLETYPRRAHFAYFSSLSYPYVGVTVNVDVTALVRRCRAEGWSFYLTFLHAAALAADGVPELRRRIHQGGIVEYDECPTSHVELLADGTYCYCTLRHHMPFSEYLPRAERQRALSREAASIEEDEDAEGMYFISTLPWLRYTALIQPVAGGEESNPRITWGRYEADAAGRLQLPVSLLVHHALADGVHIAAFYANLNKEIGTIANTQALPE